MDGFNSMGRHDRIQMELVSALRDIGVEAIQKHAGKRSKADVYVPNNGKPMPVFSNLLKNLLKAEKIWI